MNARRTIVCCSAVVFTFLFVVGAAQAGKVRSVRRPVTHTSGELIDAAEAAGRIDHETALTYEVFAALGDCRLPQEFIGNAPPLPDSDILLTLRTQFPTLSPAAQATLQPFLLPPDAHGSWAELPSNCANQSKKTSVEAAADDLEWLSVETTNHKAVIKYEKRFGQEEAERALTVQIAFDSVWPTLTGFFGGRVPATVDGHVQIKLVPMGNELTSYEYDGLFAPTACAAAVGDITINDLASDLRGTLVHELTHAILQTYGTTCGDYPWLNEATATWAEHFVYPETFGRPGAQYFLDHPDLPLETFEKHGWHQYGAYLFLLFVEKGLGQPLLIRQIWDNSTQADSLVNIDSVLAPQGGFKTVWPQFVRYNWNREPVDDYHRWDPLPTPFSGAVDQDGSPKKLEESGDGMTDETIIRPKLPLAHLTAQYYVLDPPSQTSLLFLNGWTFNADKNNVDTLPFAPVLAYTSVPLDTKPDTIRLEVLAKKGGKWEQYVGSNDWTDKGYVAHCNVLPDQLMENVVFIVSNSEFRDRKSTYTPPKLPLVMFFSNAGCSAWNGSAKSVDTWDDGSASGATTTQESEPFSWERVRDLPSTVPYRNGVAIWGYNFIPRDSVRVVYTIHSANCSTSPASGESFEAAPTDVNLQIFSFIPPGSSLYRTYFAADTGAARGFTANCKDGSAGSQPFSLWLFTGDDNGKFSRLSQDGQTLCCKLGPPDSGWVWKFTGN